MVGPRVAQIHRKTSESDVQVKINLDGTGKAKIDSGVGFYDHMLTTLAKHSLIDMEISCTGDVEIDAHHSVEDIAITLGMALAEALGDKKGIRRFGEATIPLDEALSTCVVDVAGRPFCVHEGEPEGQIYARIGGSGVPYQGSMTQHVMQSLSVNSGLAIHLRVLAGRDPHHIVETQFKALARALRQAIEYDPRVSGVPSTKGSLG